MSAALVLETNAAPAAEDGKAPAYRPRILVVDDVAENRDVLTRRLVRRGFDVVEASGGLPALAEIAAQSFDLVLLDIMMPDLTGNEVLRRVRETLSPTDLPIIMVSAKSQSEDVVESIELGANDYVTKPVDFAVALVRIKAQIERKQTADLARASRDVLEVAVIEQQEKLLQTSESLAHEADQRRQSNDKLEFLAFHDALTGLLNRRAFRARLEDALKFAESAPFALIFIDLDRFKSINDDRGHEVGDRLLQSVTERLRLLLDPAILLGRLGGDEFGALMPPHLAGRAVETARVIVEALSTPFAGAGQMLTIGASCGVARSSVVSGSADDLVNAADLAMYVAKSLGRGQAVEFETHMLDTQRERRRLEEDLRLAIQQGAFDVFYQPLIDTATGRLVSFEALLRWPHPTRGMISPDRFIPIAEETGLIVELGGWVLRRACAEAATWPKPIRVAVNLSPLQFRSKNLLPLLVNTLATTGLERGRLELEITESALLEAKHENFLILQAIRELGVRLCMDDFGTGYSSMSYLQNFRFDKIKIDRSFVHDLAVGSSSSAIVKAIVDLSSKIGVSTTAEGVETAEQLDHIAQHGCQEAQGYYLSRPMSAADVRDFINRMCLERA